MWFVAKSAGKTCYIFCFLHPAINFCEGDHEIQQKRILLVLAILTMAIVLSFVFVACGTDADKQGRQFTITFDTQGGSKIEPIKIKAGATITLPNNPTKEGYVFEGWYLSDALVEEFNITKTITGDITLYAKWIEDNGQEEPPVAKPIP